MNGGLLAAILAVVVVVAFVVLARVTKHPEQTATHDGSAADSERPASMAGGEDRPAGPGAEDPSNAPGGYGAPGEDGYRGP